MKISYNSPEERLDGVQCAGKKLDARHLSVRVAEARARGAEARARDAEARARDAEARARGGVFAAVVAVVQDVV